MDRPDLSVHFTCNEDDGSYIFVFPCKELLQMSEIDVERSRPLRHLIESAATCGEATITFPSSVELSHFHNWAAAVQPSASIFQKNATNMATSLKAADFFADECSMQRLASAYAKRLFPRRAAAVDDDFLRELEGMGEDLVRIVLAASSRPVGQRAWLLPGRLHPFDDTITAVSSMRMHMQATAAAEAQRSEQHGQKVHVGQGTEKLWAAALSSDGQMFATCLDFGHVAVWHTATGMLMRTLQASTTHTATFRCAAWSPDGALLATGSRDGSTTVWKVARCAVKLTLGSQSNQSEACVSNPHRAIVCSVAWSPNGLQICTGSEDGIARLWDVGTGDLLHELACQSGAREHVRSVDWSPDGDLVATASDIGRFPCVSAWASPYNTVTVWDAVTGVATRVLGGQPQPVAGPPTTRQHGPISSVAWSPKGGMLMAGTACHLDRNSLRNIGVWDAATGTAKHTLEGGRIIVGAVAWSPDGRLLAITTQSSAKAVWLWEVATGTMKRVIHVAGAVYLHSVAWGPCGRFVFVATIRGTVHIYNVSEGQ